MSGKSLRIFVKKKPVEHLMYNTYLLTLSTSCSQFFSKMSVNKMATSTNRTPFLTSKRSIQRRLKYLKLPFNILQEAFSRSREVLAAKQNNFLKQGQGNKPNACRELTNEEQETLFETGDFGCHNPEALQRTLWLFLCHSTLVLEPEM